jgi:hypothetical protein
MIRLDIQLYNFALLLFGESPNEIFDSLPNLAL